VVELRPPRGSFFLTRDQSLLNPRPASRVGCGRTIDAAAMVGPFWPSWHRSQLAWRPDTARGRGLGCPPSGTEDNGQADCECPSRPAAPLPVGCQSARRPPSARPFSAPPLASPWPLGPSAAPSLDQPSPSYRPQSCRPSRRKRWRILGANRPSWSEKVDFLS
jgi:hypothetical protein